MDRTLYKIMIPILLSVILSFTLKASDLDSLETKESARLQKVKLDFKGMIDIKDFAEWIAPLIGKNLLFDHKLSGKFNIVAPNEVTIEEAYEILASTLSLLGYTTVENGKILRIVKQTEAKKGGTPILKDSEKLLDSDLMATKIFRLKNIESKWAAATLSRFVTTGSLSSISETNSLIMIDQMSNIKKVEDVLELLDIEENTVDLNIIKIRYGDPKEIVRILQETHLSSSSTSGSGSRLRQSPTQRKLVIFALEVVSAIAIFSDSGQFQKLKKTIEKLDEMHKTKENASSGIYVRPLSFTKSDTMAKVLTVLSQNRGSLSNNQKESASNKQMPKIVSDPQTNSLIITSSPKDFNEINYIIRKLDTKKSQVLIETQIIEVNSRNNFFSGTSWLAGGGSKEGAKVISAWEAKKAAPMILSQNSLDQGSKTKQATDILGQMSSGINLDVMTSKGVYVDGIGTVAPNLLIQFLQEDGDSKTLAKPFIMTSNNEEAQLVVGETVFFSSIIGQENGHKKIEKENVDLSIDFLPTVSAHKFVSLKMSIDANQLMGMTADGVPILSKKKFKQLVEIKSGDTIVVSGFKTTRELFAMKKVPLLGDLPIIGVFFHNLHKSKVEQNILVFVTPYVIDSMQELKDIYAKRLNYLKEGFENIAVTH